MSPRKLVLGILAAALGLAAGCGASSEAKPDRICNPNAYVFCRCQDRQEGTKQCNAEGSAYGSCVPCESWDNPELTEDGRYPGPRGEVPFGDEDGGGEEPVGCGDGTVQAGEDCDDGDDDDTNGCDKRCKLAGDNPAPTRGCPGLEVHVWGGPHNPTLTGSTSGSGNRSASPKCEGAGGGTTGSTASDRVYKVVAHKSGDLAVTVSDVTFDVFLYAADACAAGAVSYRVCRNAASGNAGETLTVPVESGKTYYVFVDGVGLSSGQYRVTFSIP